jgi:hypothetical protein
LLQAFPYAANREKANKNPGIGERRYAWVELLKRVFSVDALKCDRCGGKMRILCAIHPSAFAKASADKPCRFFISFPTFSA